MRAAVAEALSARQTYDLVYEIGKGYADVDAALCNNGFLCLGIAARMSCVVAARASFWRNGADW
jgi:hypothetical protein